MAMSRMMRLLLPSQQLAANTLAVRGRGFTSSTKAWRPQRSEAGASVQPPERAQSVPATLTAGHPCSVKLTVPMH